MGCADAQDTSVQLCIALHEDVQTTSMQMCSILPYNCATQFHTGVQHTYVHLCNTLHADVQNTSSTPPKKALWLGDAGVCSPLLSALESNECHSKETVSHFFFAENIKFIYVFLIPYQASQLPENKITTVTQNGFELLIQFCLNENWYNYIIKMMTNDLRLLIFLSWNFTTLIDRVEVKASGNHFLRKYLASLFIKFQSVNNPRFIKGAILRLFMDVIAFWNEVLGQRKQCSYDTIMLNGRK